MPNDNDVLSRLEALAPDLPAEIERLEGQRAQIDAQIKRLRRLHTALTDTPAPPSPSPRKARAAKSVHQPSVGLPRQLDIAEAMLSFEEPFTAGDVAERTGIGESQIHRVIRRFREIEFIGKAGKRPPGGGKGHGAVLWRVLDAHAIDSLRAKVRSERNGVPA